MRGSTCFSIGLLRMEWRWSRPEGTCRGRRDCCVLNARRTDESIAGATDCIAVRLIVEWFGEASHGRLRSLSVNIRASEFLETVIAISTLNATMYRRLLSCGLQPRRAQRRGISFDSLHSAAMARTSTWCIRALVGCRFATRGPRFTVGSRARLCSERNLCRSAKSLTLSKKSSA